MLLKQILTQANASVELEFRAMERSLRATGCDLPLRVIPFDDQLFDLPKNSEWLHFKWPLSRLREIGTHPCHQRYGILTESNYQYADTDIIFLKDPESVLVEHSGFIATCTQWQLPQYAVTPESMHVFTSRSGAWKLNVFNSGQFACEFPLYSAEELVNSILEPKFRSTFFLKVAPWDQPGFNLLVHQTSIQITNLTLPPYNLPSTWAGDYPGGGCELWKSQIETPYLIHWAGGLLYEDRSINQLFFNYLTQDEKSRFEEKRKERAIRRSRAFRESLSLTKRIVHDLKQFGRRIAPGVAERLKRRLRKTVATVNRS